MYGRHNREKGEVRCPPRKEPSIPNALLDGLLAGVDPAATLKSGEIFNALKKALAERVLNAEMDFHLKDEAEAGNSRRRLHGLRPIGFNQNLA